jgi:hypothetical protein
MVDVGPGVGALVVYAGEDLEGHEIEISPKGDDTNHMHTDFLRRSTASGQLYAAVFGSLPEGEYRLSHKAVTPPTDVRIVGGEIVEIDWR